MVPYDSFLHEEHPIHPIQTTKTNFVVRESSNLSYPVIKEDYLKDGCSNTHSPVRDTEWEICDGSGRQMSIFSQSSVLNGAMICLELGSEDTSGTMMNFLSKSIEGDN